MDDAAALEQGLASALAGAFATPPRIRDLRRLSGGANAETWAFDAEHPGGVAPLILRRRPEGIGQGGDLRLLPIETEAALVAHVSGCGLPAPAVAHVLGPDDGIGSGYVMERLPGETIARRILRGDRFARARPRMAQQCGEILAGLHALPVDALPALPRAGPAAQLEHYRASYEGIDDPRPVFELALRWARDQLPGDGPTTLVHGDFRHGNLIVEEDGVRGVLDWEIAHLGDPMEDLGWLCVPSWRFGVMDLPVGGFGTREALFAAYQAAGGGKVDAERVRFWEVFGTLKWGLMCMGMYQLFASGTDPSVERAAIGRRASEAEIDLLELMEV